jgi:hypothetical protein
MSGVFPCAQPYRQNHWPEIKARPDDCQVSALHEQTDCRQLFCGAVQLEDWRREIPIIIRSHVQAKSAAQMIAVLFFLHSAGHAWLKFSHDPVFNGAVLPALEKDNAKNGLWYL